MPVRKLRIIGSYLSPYVRKVLAVLEVKGIPYEVDPIVPFYGNDAFSQMSPVRRIPVLVDRERDIVLCDSTVIVEYLEDAYPDIPVYPSAPYEKARARWFEEYADSRVGDVFVWQLFNQTIRKFVWNMEVDHDVVANATKNDVPEILDYLEEQVPQTGFLLGNLTIADIALGSFFRNFHYARCSVDGARWPKVQSWVDRILALEPFQKLHVYEQCSISVPVTNVRDALEKIDAPLSPETCGTETPVAGPMTRF